MELRKNFAYSLVVPTSIGVRITPVNGQPVHSSDTFIMQTTSAETNVASISSYLGLPVKVLTAFVEGSPIAQFIKTTWPAAIWLMKAQKSPKAGRGGAIGTSLILRTAVLALGGARVHNDRAGEVGRTLNVKDFDLERIFGEEGVQIVHISGLIAALSPETSTFCLELARAAKKHGTRISFDLNHRATFWEGREEELREVFTEIAGLTDILIGNEEDYQLCLGIQGPEAGGEDIAEQIDGFKKMIGRVKESFPGASVFANTLREVESANKHFWGAILLEGEDNWHVVEPRPITVLDRIGGGDGFVGGLLYAILRGGWDSDKWIQFAWATGAMATTFLTDYAQPADEEQVWSIWEGNARVRR